MKNIKVLEFICQQCNNNFIKTEKSAKHSTKYGSDNKYCSLICERKSRKNGKIEKCLTCENDVYISLARSKISNTYFCSISCANIYKHKHGKFGNHSASNFKNIDWVKCQQEYDNGMSIDKLKQFGASIKFISKAIKLGLFLKNNDRVYVVSDMTKQKISEKLKIAYNEGRHVGWSHINSRQDRTSYPERFFLKVLKNNGLFDKYHIEQKLSIGKYFLDFAIIDLKLNIEIDGQQHFRTDEAISHDKIRNEYLISKGWKVYRICWIEFLQKTKEQIDYFLKYVDNIDNESSHYYIISDIILKNVPKFGTRLDYNTAKKRKTDLEQQQYIDIIKNSSIDFNKFGWVNKVAKIINKPHQKVKSWMLRIMPEFYESKCFKNKNNK